MNKMDKELEKKLWEAADLMRGNISSERYMHIVLGILFLKSMSDKYSKAVSSIKKEFGDKWELYAEDNDVLMADYGCSFIIPHNASWNYISEYASDNKIGEVIDNAFLLIEEKNTELTGLFEKNYNREELDQSRLGSVVSAFSNIDINKYGDDIIGRIYEYFLGQFFLKQGQKGGEFYTPPSIVELLVKLIEPKAGKMYDPACGTGGMFVQSKKYLEGKVKDPLTALTIYGQEFQNKTWKLAKINLLLQGFNSKDVHLGHRSADTFTNDQHKEMKFDYILANPPFNQKKWGLEGLEKDSRWKWGLPPKNNANYAWLSHILSKLDKKGRAAVVLANGSLSGSQKSESEFRRKIIEDNKLEMIISLPEKLFYTTGIPVCIWVFNNNKVNKDVLFIEASELSGNMISKKLRELNDDNIIKISNKLYDFRKNKNVDELGFSKVVSLTELSKTNYQFTPGRYVGVKEVMVDLKQTKKDIQESSERLSKLFKELNTLMPEVEKSIKQALEIKKEL